MTEDLIKKGSIETGLVYWRLIGLSTVPALILSLFLQHQQSVTSNNANPTSTPKRNRIDLHAPTPRLTLLLPLRRKHLHPQLRRIRLRLRQRKLSLKLIGVNIERSIGRNALAVVGAGSSIVILDGLGLDERSAPAAQTDEATEGVAPGCLMELHGRVHAGERRLGAGFHGLVALGAVRGGVGVVDVGVSLGRGFAGGVGA